MTSANNKDSTKESVVLRRTGLGVLLGRPLHTVKTYVLELPVSRVPHFLSGIARRCAVVCRRFVSGVSTLSQAHAPDVSSLAEMAFIIDSGRCRPSAIEGQPQPATTVPSRRRWVLLGSTNQTSHPLATSTKLCLTLRECFHTSTAYIAHLLFPSLGFFPGLLDFRSEKGCGQGPLFNPGKGEMPTYVMREMHILLFELPLDQ